ncbi:hypothetical protein PO909_003310, partial [Leuciscus waleckii]
MHYLRPQSFSCHSCLWRDRNLSDFIKNIWIYLCSKDERKSYGFGTTWGVKDNMKRGQSSVCWNHRNQRTLCAEVGGTQFMEKKSQRVGKGKLPCP